MAIAFKRRLPIFLHISNTYYEKERTMFKFGFIGMGNMGSAMLAGLVKKYGADSIAFSENNKDKMKAKSEQTGVAYFETNAEVVRNSKYVILAVKPVIYEKIFKEIRDAVEYSNTIISIAPGITIDELKNMAGKDVRIVRAMPNTPAMVGEGMTGVCYDENEFSESEIKEIENLFTSFGKMCKVDEKIMSTVTCASGSSPAYVYMFIEALADSAVKYGMPRQAAYRFVAQTVLGSAKMVLETGQHPGKLKDDVCSPGGTTIAAVEALEECGFRNSLFKATEKCYKKCEHLD
jgi:pyrroline-5-carboxylate reductase